jgi:hypothetical protein
MALNYTVAPATPVIAILQRCQPKMLRSMTDAPWYISNSTLRKDFGIPYIKDVIQERSSKHHDRKEVHKNQLLQPFLTYLRS